MKIFVFANAEGKVIGSFAPHERQEPGAPTFQPIPDPRSGQVVHEVEVPDHFRSFTSAAELHRELGQWLQSSRASAK
jgi:hypothetical protein